MADDLYDLRVALLLGNYATAINEGTGRSSRGKPDETLQWDREYILLRAHLALRQYDVVNQELSKKNSDSAKACGYLVAYLIAQEKGSLEGMNSAVEKLNTAVAAVKEGTWPANVTIAISAVLVFLRERAFNIAMPLIHTVVVALTALPTPPQTAILELRSYMVDCLLRLHRPDLAEKEVAEMAKIDDDSLFTQLSQVSVYVNQGYTKPDRLRDALQIVEDIRDKNGSSVLLLNMMANIHILQQNYTQAEKYLLDALEKRSTDVDTLVSLCVCSLHMKKPVELVNRYVSQLKAQSPTHPWVQQYVAVENKIASLK